MILGLSISGDIVDDRKAYAASKRAEVEQVIRVPIALVRLG
jgi:hypothetical protein